MDARLNDKATKRIQCGLYMRNTNVGRMVLLHEVMTMYEVEAYFLRGIVSSIVPEIMLDNKFLSV